MQSQKENNDTYWYGGSIEAESLTPKRNLLNKHVFVIPILFCFVAIIVMTTLSGIVEGRVCLYNGH